MIRANKSERKAKGWGYRMGQNVEMGVGGDGGEIWPKGKAGAAKNLLKVITVYTRVKARRNREDRAVRRGIKSRWKGGRSGQNQTRQEDLPGCTHPFNCSKDVLYIL
jgi:hypothetical protein